MKTLQHPRILIHSVLLTSLFLTACSVERKQGLEPNTIPEQAEISDDFEPSPGQSNESSGSSQTLLEMKKPPLTSEMLFSGTLDAHNRVRAKHRLTATKMVR